MTLLKYYSKMTSLALLLGVVFAGNAQNTSKPFIESFENKEVVQYYHASSGSNIGISAEHYKFGKQSLRWQWTTKGAGISSTNFSILNAEQSGLSYATIFPATPTFVVSLYNEKAQADSVTFNFKQDAGRKICFTVPLNFYGWRIIRVPFYEMLGDVPAKTQAVTFDKFEITTTASKGTLYLDDIVFSQFMDDRYPYPDFIVPFIKRNQKADVDHWMPLIENIRLVEQIKPPTLSAFQNKNLDTVKMRLNDILLANRKPIPFANAKRAYETLQLNSSGKTVNGPPLSFLLNEVYSDSLQQGSLKNNSIGDFGSVIRTLAIAYIKQKKDSPEKEALAKMFTNASRYFLDQGWEKGASGGSRHHIGYNTRELTEGFFLMRDVLAKEQLLSEIGESLQWLSNFGSILKDEKEFSVNIDFLNTQSFDYLLLSLLSADQNKQGALLKAYSKYMSVILSQPDKEWGFKPDGTSWHHSGHYPAYGLGAFASVPRVISLLSNTTFRIDEKGHQHFKNALLTTVAYSQLYDWGFGNAGRHPLEGNSIKSLQYSFLMMANAGSPDGKSKTDREIASAYLRLWGKEDTVNAKAFKTLGIQAIALPAYKALPYGATAIQRKNNWAAIIKGFSKYVWSSEIYDNTNRYGRYPAYGTVELLNEGGEKGSGIEQNGWDWNRFPGATVIYLPLKKLETESSLLMYLSNQSFAGAATLNGEGAFGLIIDESDGTNADGLVRQEHIALPGELKAKKSIFSLGDKLVCIGSDISDNDKEHAVQTNLFQISVDTAKFSVITDGQGTIHELHHLDKTDRWIIDPLGSGYYVLGNTPIQWQVSNQKSYNNKYSINTGAVHGPPRGDGAKETYGAFATAWMDHGINPHNGGYQYVIYPFMTRADQQRFKQKTATDNSFEILRADGVAHILLNKLTNTKSYVIFDDKNFNGTSLLQQVSAPSIIMLQNNNVNNITISAVQPDLNFSKNPNKKNGYNNYSNPTSLTIKLKGNWKSIEKKEGLIFSNKDGVTTITMKCQHGFSNVIQLNKI